MQGGSAWPQLRVLVGRDDDRRRVGRDGTRCGLALLMFPASRVGAFDLMIRSAKAVGPNMCRQRPAINRRVFGARTSPANRRRSQRFRQFWSSDWRSRGPGQRIQGRGWCEGLPPAIAG